jgi:hypothetical protein
MRERTTLRTLRQLAQAQGALQLAAQAALLSALVNERDRKADVRAAEIRLDQALEDCRGLLRPGSVDVALLGLFAQAPPRHEALVTDAKSALSKAQRQTEAHRLLLGECTARLRQSGRLKKRASQRLQRKTEEKALAALEHHARGEPA